jgi:carbon starvation protein CstA
MLWGSAEGYPQHYWHKIVMAWPHHRLAFTPTGIGAFLALSFWPFLGLLLLLDKILGKFHSVAEKQTMSQSTPFWTAFMFTSIIVPTYYYASKEVAAFAAFFFLVLLLRATVGAVDASIRSARYDVQGKLDEMRDELSKLKDELLDRRHGIDIHE